MSLPIVPEFLPRVPEAPVVTAEQVVSDTFFTAQTGRAATEADKALVAAIHEKVVALALLIEIDVPGGRNKSLAKKALEDVQMRAVRAVYSPIG